MRSFEVVKHVFHLILLEDTDNCFFFLKEKIQSLENWRILPLSICGIVCLLVFGCTIPKTRSYLPNQFRVWNQHHGMFGKLSQLLADCAGNIGAYLTMLPGKFNDTDIAKSNQLFQKIVCDNFCLGEYAFGSVEWCVAAIDL